MLLVGVSRLTHVLREYIQNMNSKSIVLTLKLLLCTDRQECSNTSGWTNKLEKNIEEYKKALETEEYRNLKETLEKVKREHCLFDGGGSSVVDWWFVCEALALLMCLKLSLASTGVSRGGNGETAKPHPAPAAPPNLLSVAEQSEVRKLLQFVAVMGVYPHLLPGVGIPLRLRMSNPVAVDKIHSPFSGWYLYRCATVLVECMENDVLCPLIVSNVLPDLFSSLIQICHAPDKLDNPVRASISSSCVQSPSDIGVLQSQSCKKGDTNSGRPRPLNSVEKEWCMAALKKLLDQLQQPLVVRQLLALQGTPFPRQAAGKKGEGVGGAGKVSAKLAGPSWLRRACGQLLSERLMCKNGLLSVMRGILEATSRKCVLCVWLSTSFLM